jgi:hypothetical protein
MIKTMIKTKWLAVVCMVVGVGVGQARAQGSAWTERGYASFNIGGQTGSHSFTAVTTPQIYGETAQISTPYKTGSGLVLDFAGRVRVWKNLGVGLGVAWFKHSSSSTLTAQIPSPIFVDSPRTATAATGNLSHQETAVNLDFLWMFPLSPKFSVAAVVGPAFINVKQALVNSLTTNDASIPPPFDPVTITSVGTESKSAWATGVDAGVDAMYAWKRTVGVGLVLRYVGGTSANLTTSSGSTVKVDAGGFQIAAGVRYKF